MKTLPLAQGDRSMMKQVFANLLSNAIKFTRPKEMATIEIGGTNDGAENIYYVKDNGVGFDMQYVNKLFGVFQRLHSSEEFEGTGVGLPLFSALSTAMVEGFGLKEKRERELSFTFRFP